MDQGLSGDVPSSPGASPPAKGGIPRWLMIVGIVVVLCLAVGGLLVCLSPVVLTLMGPAIGSQFEVIILQTDCVTENPNLSPEACQAWAEDVGANYPGVGTDCSQQYQTPADRYQCVLDQGVDPPQ